jgi:hypothetical protein
MWDGNAKCFTEIKTVKIHQAMEMMAELVADQPATIYVEDPRKIKLPRELQRKGHAADQGVGSIRRDANIWDDFLKDLKADYHMVWNPRGIRKLSSQKFKELTKWEGRTTEHGRDAAMLVWGK